MQTTLSKQDQEYRMHTLKQSWQAALDRWLLACNTYGDASEQARTTRLDAGMALQRYERASELYEKRN